MRTVNVIHICAPNDRNGNPQRCYLVLDSENSNVIAYDIGYRGTDCLPDDKAIQNAVYYANRVNVSPAEYRRILREYCPIH
jgi:hypothetical protein